MLPQACHPNSGYEVALRQGLRFNELVQLREDYGGLRLPPPSGAIRWMSSSTHRGPHLLNDVPGKWFAVQEVFEGDPLSMYLFLLVVDVLQQMTWQDDLLPHPLIDGTPLVVLQYADDMLVILRASPIAADHIVPMHVDHIVPMHVDPLVLDTV